MPSTCTGKRPMPRPEELFDSGDALNIEEIWRWNPESRPRSSSPPTRSFPPPGRRNGASGIAIPRAGESSTLTAMSRPGAYLVKCAGTAGASYSVPLKHRSLPPAAAWVRNGANLARVSRPTQTGGFPTLLATTSRPSRRPIAANSRSTSMSAADLGPANPIQVFAPNHGGARPQPGLLVRSGGDRELLRPAGDRAVRPGLAWNSAALVPSLRCGSGTGPPRRSP